MNPIAALLLFLSMLSGNTAWAQGSPCPVHPHSAKVLSQTTAYTIGGTDLCRTLVFTGSGVPGANLPYPTALTGYGFWVRIYNASGGSLNVTPQAGGTTAVPTINGSTAVTYTNNHGGTIFFGTDGNWYSSPN